MSAGGALWESGSAVRVSRTQRPEMAEGEVELFVGTDVGLYDGASKTKCDKGTLFVTSHRLVWVDAGRKLPPQQLRLSTLAKVAEPRGKTKGSPKVRLDGNTPAGNGKTPYCLLSFKKGGKDTCLQRAAEALAARAWPSAGGAGAGAAAAVSSSSAAAAAAAAAGPSASSTTTAPAHAAGASAGAAGRPGAGAGAGAAAAGGATTSSSSTFSTRSAGVGGIMRNMEARQTATSATMQEAFSDLDSLMKKAQDMVQIADTFARKQAALGKADGEETAELRSMLVQLGIRAPVTKDAAGSKYHQQLAKQLSDWLGGFLDERFNGVIAVTDLFGLFNRARGVEMISPEDLMKACKELERLGLPHRLRTFASGVSIVHSAAHTDENVAKDLRSLVKRDGPQTAYDVARLKNIPLPLAQEQLLAAERAGALVRDDVVEGITFYDNFFFDY